MWHRLKNFFLSLRTYNTLSPDLGMRQQVNQQLQHRPELAFKEWFERFYRSQGIDDLIATFAYTHLGRYSGLPIGRILPSDRLEEDLHWTKICWFDWETALCNDFWQAFGVDLSPWLYECHAHTVGELIDLLNWLMQEHRQWTNEQGVNLPEQDIESGEKQNRQA